MQTTKTVTGGARTQYRRENLTIIPEIGGAVRAVALYNVQHDKSGLVLFAGEYAACEAWILSHSVATPDEVAATLADFSASDWLKNALRSALRRDCVDALHDAERLAAILDRRTRAILKNSQRNVAATRVEDSNGKSAGKRAPFTLVEISDLGCTPTSSYVAANEAECGDETDKSAYREAVRLGDVVTMGKIVARPICQMA